MTHGTQPAPVRRLVRGGWWLLWLLLLIVTLLTAFVAHGQLARRDQLVEAVMLERYAFINDSAVHDVDEQLVMVRQFRDGALAAFGLVLILPLVWRVLPIGSHRAGADEPSTIP